MISKTETGYTNNNTILEWLQNFIYHTQNKKRSAKFLLIIIGYGLQITIPFHNLDIKIKNLLFHLLVQFQHLTQLINVRIFRLFKYYLTDAIDKTVWLVDEKFGKPEFLSRFHLFCK